MTVQPTPAAPHRAARLFLRLLCLAVLLAGCTGGPVSTPTPAAPTQPALLTPTGTSTPPAPSSTTAPTATSTPPATSTPLPTPTSSPTPVPTYAILRGEVIVDQAVCHYGPGAPYLYKYGVIRGSNLEIVRRVIGHNYIEVRAIGGDNPCWVRADYMQIKNGHLESLQPVHAFDLKLPVTPYYASPGVVSAQRDGSRVIVSWPELPLKAGDSSEQTPYVVEAWVCRAGEMVFDPVPAWQTTVQVTDEAGCDEPSRAYLVYAEKHGYTPRLAIPWPQPE